MLLNNIDHLVLTTANEIECVNFNTLVLGMQLESFIGGTPPVERKALKFGKQKINLHIKARSLSPRQTFLCQDR